jgi:hypothetical protein
MPAKPRNFSSSDPGPSWNPQLVDQFETPQPPTVCKPSHLRNLYTHVFAEVVQIVDLAIGLVGVYQAGGCE